MDGSRSRQDEAKPASGRAKGGFSQALLTWLVLYLVVRVAASFLGFGNFVAVAGGLGRFLLLAFIVAFIALTILRLLRGGRPPH